MNDKLNDSGSGAGGVISPNGGTSRQTSVPQAATITNTTSFKLIIDRMAATGNASRFSRGPAGGAGMMALLSLISRFR